MIAIKPKLEKYLKLTSEALKEAENSKTKSKKAKILIDMAKRYYNDAHYFKNKGDYLNAFSAVNYAHAFLDACAIMGFIKSKNRKLFMID